MRRFARARTSRDELADHTRPTERRLARTVTIATVITTILLLIYVTLSARTGAAIAWPTDAQTPLTIEVTGHQWWWEFRYRDSIPSQSLTTSNELHIPVGRPVAIKLTSRDVIHSLWVPNLHGKRDLIPGHEATIWLQADREGVFRGQCAELCGMDHGFMPIVVEVVSREEFGAWLVSMGATGPAFSEREPAGETMRTASNE